MKLTKLIYILLSLLLLTTTYAQDEGSQGNLIDFKQFGNEQQRIEVLTATLDLEDIDSPKNQEAVRQFREQVGLGDDTPIITERLTKSQAIRLGLERLSDQNIDEFISEYKFSNPVIDEPISEEAVNFLETGDAPEDLKEIINNELATENWEKSRKARISKSVYTPSKTYSKMSKSTLRLTAFRMGFNGLANVVAVFAKSGHIAKSLVMGAISSGMTGMVQANPEFFEKLMAGRLARLKFFGLETAFIVVPMVLSSMLEIQPLHLGHLAVDIFVYGMITVFSQGNAEIWAAKQSKRMKSFLEKQIMRVENSTELTRKAKDLLLSRLMGLHAEMRSTFSKVMVGGSLIWAQAVALAAAGLGDVAVYSTFATLIAYSLTVKYVTAKGMLALDKKAYKEGLKLFVKDLKTIHIGGPKVIKDFLVLFGQDTKYIFKNIASYSKKACSRLFSRKQLSK